MDFHTFIWRASFANLGRAFLLAAALVASTGCKSQPEQTFEVPAELDDEFSRAADRPPTAETLYRLARLLAAEKKDTQCETVLLDGIARYPGYMPLYSELADLYIRQRRMDAAIAALDKGLLVVPNDAVTLNNLGMTYMLRQDYEKALHAFTRANAADRDNARYVANMGMAAGMLGNYDEALGLYQQILTPGQSHFNVAVLAEARNDMERAKQEYAAASNLDPWMIRKSDQFNGGLQQHPAR